MSNFTLGNTCWPKTRRIYGTQRKPVLSINFWTFKSVFSTGMNQIPGLARAGQPHYARGSRLITWPTFWREAIDSSLSLRREVKCWHIDGQRCPLVNKTMTSRQKLYLSRTKTTNGVVWPSIVENYRTLSSLSGKAACSRQLLSMFEWRCLFTLEVNIAIDTDKGIYTVPLQLLESRCCSCCM